MPEKQKLPEGTIILGKNPDRLVYINAVKRCIISKGFCTIKIFLNGYDEKGYSFIGKLPSIMQEITASESNLNYNLTLNIQEKSIDVIIKRG